MTQAANQDSNLSKLEQFMDAENKKGWRVAHARRITKAYEFAKEAVCNPGFKVCTTVDAGKYQRCHLFTTVHILKNAGINHTSGNDAPNGGRHGEYVMVRE